MLSWRDTECTRCALRAGCTQVVRATPPQSQFSLLVVGEAPGGDEDEQGVGFVGASGRTLRALLGEHGLQEGAYGLANVCRCRPPGNRKPAKAEIAACLPYLADLVAELRPQVILAVGGVPANVLCAPGTLASIIDTRQLHNNWEANSRFQAPHPALKEALEHVKYIVPMPHTSPLAWNRSAPSGLKWATVGRRQIALAAQLRDRRA